MIPLRFSPTFNVAAETDTLVKRHGEHRRAEIERALRYIAEFDPTWGLAAPVNRERYVAAFLNV